MARTTAIAKVGETMSYSSTADRVTANDPLAKLVGEVRNTFDLDAVALFVSRGSGWSVVAAAGQVAVPEPTDGRSIELPIESSESTYVLVVRGRVLNADEENTLRTITDQIIVAVESGTFAAQVARADMREDIDRLRSALLLAVSHDLRTPLATIKAYVSGLRQPDVSWTPDDLAEAHAAIDAECDRLNHLVGNLLDAGRLQAGALAVVLRPIAVEELIGAAAALLPSTRVILDVPSSLPLVRTDPVLLERVLINLLANADQYCPPSSPILIDAQVVDHRVRLRVIDRGPGIAEDRHHAVFQPFQRFNDTTSEGTGLGLAITRGFIEAVGATLSLDDTPGGGLTATIVLPIAQTET